MFHETRAPDIDRPAAVSTTLINRPRAVTGPTVDQAESVAVTRVLICDRLPIMREAMSEAVGQQQDMEVAGAADNLGAALALCRDRNPQVVLTSMDLSAHTGLQLIQRLHPEGRADGPRVVVHTTSLTDHLLGEVLHAGASGVLSTDATRTEFIAAIRASAAGQNSLAPDLLQRLIGWFRQNSGRIGAEQSEAAAALTSREREVLQMMAKGRTMSQVAGDLCIELTTVRTHVYRMRCKLKIHDRAQLVSFAFRTGLM